MNFSQETTIRDRNCARGDEENPVLNHDCSSSSKSVETDLAAEVGDLASSSNSAIIMDKNITYQDSDETSLANTDPVDDHSLQNQSLDQQQPQHTNHRIVFWFPLVGMAVIVMLAALSVVVGKMILPEGCQLNNHTDRSYSSLGTPTETTTTTNTTTKTTMVPVSELAMTSQASTNATNNNTLWPTNPPKQQQQQQQSDEDDDTLFAPDAYQWPHLVGMDGDEAKAQLEIHYPQKYDIYIIRDDAMVTMDYKVDRIRIFVNVETNIVTRTPMIG